MKDRSKPPRPVQEQPKKVMSRSHTPAPRSSADSESGGECKCGKNEHNYLGDDQDVVSVYSSQSRRGESHKLQSGYLEKPRSQVMIRLTWPHMNQNPRYITISLTFNDLTFNQFVGGKCRTIMRSTDMTEMRGRLRILSKVAYLNEQSRSWEKARAAYFAIISSIEEGEADWDSSFGHYGVMCPPRIEITQPKTSRAATKPRSTVQKCDFFCKEYQRGECTQHDPHQAWIRNGYEQVEHYCVQCYRNRLGKLNHIPGADQCSSKK